MRPMRSSPRRPSRLLAPAALGALVACGCAGQAGAGDAATDSNGDAPETCVPDPSEGIDLLGEWGARAWIRVEMVTSPEGVVRVCPDPFPGMAVLTLMIDLVEKDGDRIDYDFRVCEMVFPQVKAALAPCDLEEFVYVQIGLGPELTAYIPGQSFHGWADLGGTAQCSTYVSDSLDITYGFIPSMIGGDDPLPGWDLACTAGTPQACVVGWDAVIDEDADGFPGVSLQVATEPVATITGLAYTTWRTNPHMHGIAWNSSLIQGDLSPTMEYEVVGSGANLQGIGMDEPTVKRNIPRFLLPPTGSTFRMVRVDGQYGSEDLDGNGDGGVDCEELMNRIDVIE